MLREPNLFIITCRDTKYTHLNLQCIDDDSTLSWKAKGIHTYFISRPPNWVLSTADLLKRSTDGASSLSAGIKELVDAKYVYRITFRDKEKRIAKWGYFVAEHPIEQSRVVLPEGWTTYNRRSQELEGENQDIELEGENREVENQVVYKDITSNSSSNKQLYSKEYKGDFDDRPKESDIPFEQANNKTSGKNLSEETMMLLDRWIELGLTKHKTNSSCIKTLDKYVAKLHKGTLFNKYPEFKKYHNTKFPRARIIDSMKKYATSMLDAHYEPVDKKRGRVNIDTFFLNVGYGACLKTRSLFLHYLENEPRLLAEIQNDQLKKKDKYPDMTNELKNWYSSFVMKGNNGHYTPLEMSDFITSSKRIMEFDHSKIYAMQNLKFTLRCSEPHEVVAKLLLKMFEEQIESRNINIRPSWLASDITFNESFPKFLRERNYISERGH